ncbi:MAG: DUF4139 domain-containing protein [Armatimonadetes bacterium]|nr:DUF4139 domain-containing protein [Armatimonadota bacterium]
MLAPLIALAAALAPGTTEITVYNQGLGFVKDVRTVSLKKGVQDVVVEDVAQLIDATSVGFKCLNNPGSISVLEQNYQYDLISPQAILEKSVGKRVRFTRTMGTSKEVVEGTLLSSPTSVVNTGNGPQYSYNGLVIKADDGRIILSPQGEIDVMEMPEGLISKPSLLWQIDSDKAQDAKMELSYLTQGISWTANYVFTLDPKGTGDMQGWVTLTNQSGLSFTDASLKLLAGDVNVVRNQARYGAADAVKAAGGRGGFQEEGLFEYHLYTLDRPATVRNKETKQLSLLEGSDIPYKKQIVFDSMGGYNNYYPSEGEVGVGDLSPLVKIKFTNNTASHLGMPMPAGKVRLYQRDSKGSLQFIGEDQINHTPHDEQVTLNVGRSFDVRGSRKRTDFKRLGDRQIRETFQIEVRNRKEESTPVYVYERHWGDWKVTQKSDNFTKEDANTMVFEVNLKPNEVKTITYTVDTTW